VIDHLREVVAVFLERAAFGCHVGVVKAVVIDTQLGEKLKGRSPCRWPGPSARRCAPRALEGAHAKHIRPWPDEGVPITGGHAQVLAHRFAEDQFIGVVVAKGEGASLVGPSKRTFSTPGKYVMACSLLFWAVSGY
jgi:hypothetical protein